MRETPFPQDWQPVRKFAGNNITTSSFIARVSRIVMWATKMKQRGYLQKTYKSALITKQQTSLMQAKSDRKQLSGTNKGIKLA